MRHFLLAIVIVLVIAMGLSSCLCQPRYASFANDKSCLTSNPMHIDFIKKLPMHPKTGGMGRINDIAIRYVAKLSGKGVSTVQRVKRLIKVQSPQ